MRHRLSALFSGLSLGLLTGCSSPLDFREYAAYHRGDLNRPSVQVTPVSFQHPVLLTETGTFDAVAKTRVRTFLNRVRPAPGDEVEVRFSLQDTAQEKAARQLEAFLRHYRLQPVLAGTDQAANLQVIVNRHQITLPACPDWTQPSGWTSNNQVHGNWGCATTVNLGLMVANPSDLVQGRQPGLGDAERGTGAIQRYRAGETKPLLDSSTGAPSSSSGSDAGGGG